MNQEEGKKIVIYWNAKKTASVICALLLIPPVMLFLFSLTIKTTIISPNYYKKVLVKANTYNRLIDEGIPALILEREVSDNALTDSFAKDISVLLIQKFVDSEWVQTQTENLVDKIAAYFARPDAGINFDLSSAQGTLTNIESALGIAGDIVPTCQTAPEDQTQAKKLVGDKFDCTKSEEVKNDLIGINQKVAQIELGAVNISHYIENTNAFIDGIKGFASKVNIYFWVSLLVLIGLAAAIFALEAHDIPFGVRAFVLPVGIGSLIMLFVSLVLKLFVISTYIGAGTTQLPQAILNIANDAMRIFVTGILRHLIIASIVAIVFAAALYIAAVVLENKGFGFWGRAGRN